MKTYLSFTRSQRAGLLILFAAVVGLQVVIALVEFSPDEIQEDQSWTSLQKEIDSLKAARLTFKPRMYPFNPNFITDYRGHVLGLSVEQIDRLHAFRKEGKFVNSAKAFQQVTGISDSLLATLEPYFKFPDWVQKKAKARDTYMKPPTVKRIDINLADKQELMAVYGIGDKLSDRILDTRAKLGGFVSMEQIREVWGLSDEVIAQLHQRFDVLVPLIPPKINVNRASVAELAKFPYFRYALARKIVTARSMNGDFKSIEDISKVDGFPVEKKEIIAVYLDF
ncbi:MAG TPA: helix-hairpin-helix domain-containing protein [Flavobacterium sp.]|nr:helix-hairpin-helix domain-containing protein [Flavobacterium sp.]